VCERKTNREKQKRARVVKRAIKGKLARDGKRKRTSERDKETERQRDRPGQPERNRGRDRQIPGTNERETARYRVRKILRAEKPARERGSVCVRQVGLSGTYLFSTRATLISKTLPRPLSERKEDKRREKVKAKCR